jgi:DNA-binding NarL/FixJ family response regulator
LEASLPGGSPTQIDRPDSKATSSSQPATSKKGGQTTAEEQHGTISVFLADDHNLLRRTLVGFLKEQDDLVVVGEAGDGESALQQVIQLKPNVLMLDLNMPTKGGLDVLPDIRSQAPDVKVLVLTGRNEDWYIMSALRAGAHGYILKSSEEQELLDAIYKVMQGHLVLGMGVAEKVVSGLLGGRSEADGRLNDVERRILLYVAAGHGNEQISDALDLSMTQVIETLASTMNKLGVRDRNTAALVALKQGYIVLDELHTLST